MLVRRRARRAAHSSPSSPAATARHDRTRLVGCTAQLTQAATGSGIAQTEIARWEGRAAALASGEPSLGTRLRRSRWPRARSRRAPLPQRACRRVDEVRWHAHGDRRPATRSRPCEPGRGEPRRYCGRWYRLCGRALEGSSSRRSDLRTNRLFGPPCRLCVKHGWLRLLEPPPMSSEYGNKGCDLLLRSPRCHPLGTRADAALRNMAR